MAYALQVADDLSFSRAAQHLHIAQPSLSQQISKLESELGVKLFHRNPHFIELTDAGKRFCDRARLILDSVEQLKREMSDEVSMEHGNVIIGCLPMTGTHVLPRVIPAFRTRYPSIAVNLVEDTTEHLETAASQGKLDVTLLSLPILSPSLDYQPVFHEEIWAVVPQNHLLAGSKEIVLRDLQDEPFIVLKKGQGFRQTVFDLCGEAGFTPQVVFESSNIETVQSLVAAGMGVALVPSMVSRSQNLDFPPLYKPISGRPSRTLVAAYKKGRYQSRAALAFIEVVQSVLQLSDPK
ncbi:MAG: transcriptional regulator [Bacilli bacterium]|nr:transcriptional regulator [Bacilli bacterium]